MALSVCGDLSYRRTRASRVQRMGSLLRGPAPYGAVTKEEAIMPGRAIGISLTLPKVGEVVFVSLYAQTGQREFVTDDKAALFEDVANFLRCRGKPFMVGGDFNTTPRAFGDWCSAHFANSWVFAPKEATCNVGKTMSQQLTIGGSATVWRGC